MAEQPRPKSPPGYVDLYGKRRQQAKLQVLEREIGLLQEELKSLENIQPTSRCCKEINEFLSTKEDPLITDINQKSNDPNCSWGILSGCCQTNNRRQQRSQKKRSCCGCKSSESCCCKCCCSSQICSCFRVNCCSFKLSCSSNCCSKVSLCPSCLSGCCRSSFCH